MQVLVDCAGGQAGGARRFRDELHRWLNENPDAPIRLIGSHGSVSARHLIEREVITLWKEHRRVIALNNIGCITSRAERWVLLRNALHFPLPNERPELPGRVARRLPIEMRIVRKAATRAKVLIAPSTAMAERVLRHLPTVGDRLRVVPHPVTPRSSTGTTVEGLVVCPVLFAPYKDMHRHLQALCFALRKLPGVYRRIVEVQVTATKDEVADLGLTDAHLLNPVGRLSAEAVGELLSRAQAIYYPPQLESFGYPLAEARVNGQPVVAPDTPHNREIAGAALVPYLTPTPDSIADALRTALANSAPAPDPEPFSPSAYFDRWIR